jgi:riboflavin-specific deaminase-like protein
VHALRARCQAIVVGIGTVLADDPKLTVKWTEAGLARGKEPLRVVLDAGLRTPPGAHVLDAAAPTVVFHAVDDPPDDPRFVRLGASDGRLRLEEVLDKLDRLGVRRVMVEGGGHVLGGFLGQDLVDTATVYVAPWVLGKPEAPRIVLQGDAARWLRLAGVERMGEGLLLTLERRRG